MQRVLNLIVYGYLIGVGACAGVLMLMGLAMSGGQVSMSWKEWLIAIAYCIAYALGWPLYVWEALTQ